MVKYHEELARASVLLDANGLHASARGFRVRWHAGKQTLVDGPFSETKGLSRDEPNAQSRPTEDRQ